MIESVPAMLMSHYTTRIRVNFIKEYAEYLLDNRVVDSKKACMNVVGKLISAAMDNGECEISAVEEIKQYIDSKTLRSEANKKQHKFEKFTEDLFEDATDDITDNVLNSIPENISTKLKQMIQAKQVVESVEEELEEAMGDISKDIINRFMSKYGKLINPKFLSQFKI